MTDSDLPDTNCPGKWPRPLRLVLDSIVTVLVNAYVMARSCAAGSPSKIVRVLAEYDEALWKLRLSTHKLRTPGVVFWGRALVNSPDAPLPGPLQEVF